MLLVHGSLAMGGVETFYVRLAQERKKRGLVTRFLILSHEGKSNPALVASARASAEVYFLSDLVSLPALPAWSIVYHFSLLYPLRYSLLSRMLDGISCAHVSNGFCAHMVMRLASILKVDIPISIGLYHSMEFSWGRTLKKLPFFELKNREIFHHLQSTHGLVFFNEKMIERYSGITGKDFSNVNLFPLGVVGRTLPAEPKRFSEGLDICSVGRLVRFKGYNLWMLDVVDALRKLGLPVSYSIYGDGPLDKTMSEKIKKMNLEDFVFLKGSLDYSDFSKVVSEFDVFVGSGTALVEAASLGVPSLIAIENTSEPSTYGFLSEIPGFSYNEDGLYPKKDILKLLVEFSLSSETEKRKLSVEQKRKSELFSISTCASNFGEIQPASVLNSSLTPRSHWFYRLFYTGSFVFYSLLLRSKGRTLSQTVSSVE
ncbi:glycosyltransferase [Pseudomonas mediterranea]|uniref:glycosyltransferase n=1 Tax=Pseudomonas mediterranea TaxID=183795 RepID=UPI0009E944F0|nr:glycosyltransferase [Pseudomonas mediterranea]MDU9029255.1 glycosyltransferase [Pseudomonas mediterranea]